MSPDELRDELQRYRTGYLRLRRMLHDRTTDLRAYPLLLDRLRTLLDDRRSLGVLVLHASNLELVESLYGWQIFDRVVARAAETLRGALRELPRDTLLGLDRVAGGEFVVFVPATADGGEVDGEFLAGVAETLRRRLEQSFEHRDFAGLNPALEFRAGHALLSINPFYRFERRVYAAVEEARTREARRDRRRERSMADELRRIIDDAAVRTLFQPVVDLADRSVLGYEALARGPANTPFEMPSTLFAVSSRAGVDVELDRLCRNAALRESSAVEGQGELFINVLPVSLDDPEWSRGLAAPPGRPGHSRWKVVLEVSERGADRDPEGFGRAMAALRAQGFAISLDDIGTAYASRATLESVRPDYLKVDVSLVRDIDRHPIKQEILASLLRIAEDTGARLVAEGIETEAEAAFLREQGARYGQGYLFAGPAPANGGRA